ncbi:DUF5624 domain-containing protein [Thiotrichales bacterium 19X7-9]|nr:DUF5624 domain-containing protein [Thiotrichales bacterium 19X7-9]
MKKYITIFALIFSLGAVSYAQTEASETTVYQTPTAFYQLLHSFYGQDKSIGTTLSKEMQTNSTSNTSSASVLILFLNSDLYIYDQNRKLLAHESLRVQPNSGFFEMTSISHIGPAIAYLLYLKNLGDTHWKSLALSLLDNIKSTYKVNNQKPNWVYQLNNPAWQGHQKAIHCMSNYALSLSKSYLTSILKNPNSFNETTFKNNFIESHSKAYPIPYNNVMIGTFMLVGLDDAYRLHQTFSKLDINWQNAKVILRNVAGSNYTAGLTKDSNWYYNFLKVESNNQLPDRRIFIAAYAKVLDSVGDKTLPLKAYNYYTESVWGALYNREIIANKTLSFIADITTTTQSSSLPGDYSNTKADDIAAFSKRLKYTFSDPTQMLSNTIGFWIPQALANNHYDAQTIKLPGLEAGFPKGIMNYPCK